MPTAEEMQRTAQEMRIQVLRMNHKAGSGHTGGSFSSAEIMTVLYDHVMNIRPDEPEWEDRDRFVLSKGHAAPMLYATMARKGFFDPELLWTLRQTGSPLQGHPCKVKLPGVEVPSGPLGFGSSVGLGMALAAELNGKSWKTYVLCGDGELDEGQNWEAFMSIHKWNPKNLTIIIDNNHVQLDGTVDEVMPLGNIQEKLESFGLKVICCDGHDTASLMDAFAQADAHGGTVAILAETVKGKGVSFMEGQSAWHGKPVSDDDLKNARVELEGALK